MHSGKVRTALALTGLLALAAAAQIIEPVLAADTALPAPSDTGLAPLPEQPAGGTREYPLEGGAVIVEERDEAPPAQAPRPVPRSRSADGSGLTLGLRLGWFHYNELLPMADVRASLDSLLSLPYRVRGRPKSTEYGICPGLRIEGLVGPRGSGVFFRPRLGLTVGVMNVYDGSDQGELDTLHRWPDPLPDTAVVTYTPVEDNKMNYFFQLGFDLGGRFSGRRGGMAFYSGLDGRLWTRAFPGTMTEYYLWLNLPLGIAGHLNVGDWRLGLDGRLNIMAGGTMNLNLGRGSARIIPPVTLSHDASFGGRLGFRLEAPMQKRMSNALSLRLTPWFEYCHFGKSEVESFDAQDEFGDVVHVEFLEPASETYCGGLALDFVVHFRR